MSASGVKSGAPACGDAAQLADNFFREEAGKLISVLTRIFGFDRLDLAEDVVQEALARALQLWPYHGIPKNPGGWITQTAKHLALDVVRRESLFRNKEPEIISYIEQWTSDSDSAASPQFESEIRDGRLRLMFACCHPVLPLEAQTALALKTLCGFSPAEIASAFLTSEAAINKRLTRAKQKIREEKIAFEIPSGDELPPRLDSVLTTVYLLFNEGYKASSGDTLVREDLCSEAIRLGAALAEHPVSDRPRTHALLALMLLNTARLASRVDAGGNILRLKDQDRALWNRSMIARGMYHLAMSANGDELTAYHLQAGIAACHCSARDYASTDWNQILVLYDRLIEIDNSPVVALNRAVALALVRGPAEGMKAVYAIKEGSQLDSYYLLHAVLGDFEEQKGNFASAADHFRQAIKLTDQKSEQSFLTERLHDCEQVQTLRKRAHCSQGPNNV